jgi:hypothetical protein
MLKFHHDKCVGRGFLEKTAQLSPIAAMDCLMKVQTAAPDEGAECSGMLEVGRWERQDHIRVESITGRCTHKRGGKRRSNFDATRTASSRNRLKSSLLPFLDNSILPAVRIIEKRMRGSSESNAA